MSSSKRQASTDDKKKTKRLREFEDVTLPKYDKDERACMRKCLESWGMSQFEALKFCDVEIVEKGTLGVHFTKRFSQQFGALAIAPPFWKNLQFFQFALEHIIAIRLGVDSPDKQELENGEIVAPLATLLEKLVGLNFDESSNTIQKAIEEVSRPVMPIYIEMLQSQYAKHIVKTGNKGPIKLTTKDLSNLAETWDNYAEANTELSVKETQNKRKLSSQPIKVVEFQNQKKEDLDKCSYFSYKPIELEDEDEDVVEGVDENVSLYEDIDKGGDEDIEQIGGGEEEKGDEDNTKDMDQGDDTDRDMGKEKEKDNNSKEETIIIKNNNPPSSSDNQPSQKSGLERAYTMPQATREERAARLAAIARESASLF